MSLVSSKLAFSLLLAVPASWCCSGICWTHWLVWQGHSRNQSATSFRFCRPTVRSEARWRASWRAPVSWSVESGLVQLTSASIGSSGSYCDCLNVSCHSFEARYLILPYRLSCCWQRWRFRSSGTTAVGHFAAIALGSTFAFLYPTLGCCSASNSCLGTSVTRPGRCLWSTHALSAGIA